MLAAPTAQEDFQLLLKFNKKNWKEKIVFLEELTDQLPIYSNPMKIEICFLEFLHEKNVNVLLKVIRLFACFVQIYGIKNLNFRQLTQVILNCSYIAQVPVSDLVIQLYQSAVCQKQKQMILIGLEDSIDSGKQKYVLQIWTKLLKNNLLHKFNQIQILQSNCKKCLMNSTVSMVDDILEFMKALSDAIGANAIIFARKIGLSRVLQLNQYVNSKKCDEKYENVEIHYIYDIVSQEWLEDYKYVPMKVLALSLRNATQSQQSIELTAQILESLNWLSERKISNLNNYIYTLVLNNIYHSRTYQKNSQILFCILFQIIGNKKINKNLQQQINSKTLTSTQEIWLNTITPNRLLSNIQKSNIQQQYHRFVIICQLLQKRSFKVSQFCKQMLKKNNLSKTYRVRLQSMMKIQTNNNCCDALDVLNDSYYN